MGKQSRNQQASTKSVKMSPFLFFTLLIVASSGFEVNQKAAAGYENRRPANLREKLIPANLREKLIRDKLPKPLPSKPVLTKDEVVDIGLQMENQCSYPLKFSVEYSSSSASHCPPYSGENLKEGEAGYKKFYMGPTCYIDKITAVLFDTQEGTSCKAANNVGYGYKKHCICSNSPSPCEIVCFNDQ